MAEFSTNIELEQATKIYPGNDVEVIFHVHPAQFATLYAKIAYEADEHRALVLVRWLNEICKEYLYQVIVPFTVHKAVGDYQALQELEIALNKIKRLNFHPLFAVEIFVIPDDFKFLNPRHVAGQHLLFILRGHFDDFFYHYKDITGFDDTFNMTYSEAAEIKKRLGCIGVLPHISESPFLIESITRKQALELQNKGLIDLIELSAARLRADPENGYRHFVEEVAGELGIPIITGTDAHQFSHLKAVNSPNLIKLGRFTRFTASTSFLYEGKRPCSAFDALIYLIKNERIQGLSHNFAVKQNHRKDIILPYDWKVGPWVRAGAYRVLVDCFRTYYKRNAGLIGPVNQNGEWLILK